MKAPFHFPQIPLLVGGRIPHSKLGSQDKEYLHPNKKLLGFTPVKIVGSCYEGGENISYQNGQRTTVPRIK